MSRVMRKRTFCKCENKDTISAFVFATRIVQSLKPLSFSSGCTAWFCVRPGQNPQLVFSCRGSYNLIKNLQCQPKELNMLCKWAATWENRIFAYAKTKTQISFAVTAKLISAFVFATRIVHSLYFLKPKFETSSHLKWMPSPFCVGPGRKPRRPVFSRRGLKLSHRRPLPGIRSVALVKVASRIARPLAVPTLSRGRFLLVKTLFSSKFSSRNRVLPGLVWPSHPMLNMVRH